MGTHANSLFAQNSKRILQRDSLDYTAHSLHANTNNNEFNPIVYKGGVLFVSNKKNETNLTGVNKIYWLPNSQFYTKAKDSAFKSVRLNHEFTAPTSNDNNILTNYSSKKYKSHLNNNESAFSDFNPDGAFAINDSANEVFYSQLSARKIKGAYRWELWHAYLKEGRLIHPRKFFTEKDTANYIYPHLTDSGRTLLFSSNKTGGKGGYDIYAIEKKNNDWDTAAKALNDINTSFNEIAPTTNKNSLSEIYYSSDKTGGMGGYDAYKYSRNSNASVNFGYPLNTSNDELGIATINNVLFLTTIVAGKPEINFFEYNPINISVKGNLTYAFDSSLVANQKLYITDKDEFKIIDSVTTDDKSNFSFIGKPNRNYLISTINKDGYKEIFDINTESTKGKDFYKHLALSGRSDKQIIDSIRNITAMAEQRRIDSIKVYITNNKFIVYYDFAKFELLPLEKRVLDSALISLKNNPSIYAIIGAFTDCIGSYEYNYKLSVKRGKAVVDYLIKHGLNKNRIITNGYSKKYSVTACLTGNSKDKKQLLQDNRRSELVFSDTKSTNWANLETSRGAGFYTARNTFNKNKVGSLSLPTENISIKAKNLSKISTNESLAIKATSTAKDIVKIKVKPKAIVAEKIKDTPVVKLTVVKKKELPIKVVKSFINKDTIKSKASVKEADEELSKEEILKSLEVLAKLKKEQERIVDYLTKRINKKPILIYVTTDTVSVEIYDNGIHDNDSVSVIYNKRIVVDKQELKVNQPIKFKLKVDKNAKNNELVFIAENLGSEPPNTGVMFITDRPGHRQQVVFSTDMTHNEVVYFINISKQ